MAKYRVMFPDQFEDVEADSELDAARKMAEKLIYDLTNTPVSELPMIAWETE